VSQRGLGSHRPHGTTAGLNKIRFFPLRQSQMANQLYAITLCTLYALAFSVR